ncbi:MAG TPA: MerR family transcriptional regulator [Acidimicrobiales bacterium]|nr:MerR family transcriptional regulator [Acidimicrobiales bacterium]
MAKRDNSKLAAGLGASKIERLPKRPSGLPLGLLHMRRQVQDRLKSTGGRPSDPSWTVSRQIPFKAETWQRLQETAETLGSEGRRVGAAQVAAILIERGLGLEGAAVTPSVRDRVQSLPAVDAAQAAELIGVTYRQLDHWERTGLVHSARRTGRNRFFAVDQLVKGRALRELLALGGPGKRIVAGLEDEDLSKRYVVVVPDGPDWALRPSDTLDPTDGLTLVIDLDAFRRTLLDRVAPEVDREEDTNDSSASGGHSAAV